MLLAFRVKCCLLYGASWLMKMQLGVLCERFICCAFLHCCWFRIMYSAPLFTGIEFIAMEPAKKLTFV
jgi:hypothetical protein